MHRIFFIRKRFSPHVKFYRFRLKIEGGQLQKCTHLTSFLLFNVHRKKMQQTINLVYLFEFEAIKNRSQHFVYKFICACWQLCSFEWNLTIAQANRRTGRGSRWGRWAICLILDRHPFLIWGSTATRAIWNENSNWELSTQTPNFWFKCCFFLKRRLSMLSE